MPKCLPNRLNQTHLFLLCFSASHIFRNVLCVKSTFSDGSFAVVFHRTEISRAADTQNFRVPDGMNQNEGNTRISAPCSETCLRWICSTSRTLNIGVIKIIYFYSPIMCNFTWGFQQISSMTRCRSISSSYWTIVVLKTLNISSAAAVSRSLTNSLKLSTELIVLYYSLNNELRCDSGTLPSSIHSLHAGT